MTERLPFHFSLSCIGEGNGNPLQCSCLENPRDGGAWWAAICGVAQSQTRLKRLSSSSSSSSSSNTPLKNTHTLSVIQILTKCLSIRFLISGLLSKIENTSCFGMEGWGKSHVLPLVSFFFFQKQFKMTIIDSCSCSVTQSCLTLQSQGLQHTRLPHPSLSPRVCLKSCPSSW